LRRLYRSPEEREIKFEKVTVGKGSGIKKREHGGEPQTKPIIRGSERIQEGLLKAELQGGGHLVSRVYLWGKRKCWRGFRLACEEPDQRVFKKKKKSVFG